MSDMLNKMLDDIEKYYSMDMNDYDRALAVSQQWRDYFILAHNCNVDNSRAYDLFLLGENNSFIIDEVNSIKDISDNDIKVVINDIKNVLDRRANGDNVGISYEQAIMLLNWSISNTRRQLMTLGINVINNSLNGLCDLTQISSLVPFENLGLKVTKNSIEDTFDCRNHHVFGTVTFPISNNGEVTDMTFLVDPTYRQFFTATRCNEGRYYMSIEDNLVLGPDPGYFMNDESKINFSKELIANGFVILNHENAKIYGDAFSYSNTTIYELTDKKSLIDSTSGDYYINRIMNSSLDYSLDIEDLEDYAFATSFPGSDQVNNKK